ncbi:Prefoldin, subunit 3 [Wallemia mellicola CBS 633.66]|uniref:Prefoldin subunit 3 n=2 Tax=Wallemia mellicola TaxID=1708541 RepID=A0A4T0PH61_9BASI|nr:Prefoldin, subunit 3 [Wallemia mellicola CBS 633.66]TIB95229.1 Prefoldin, subunit 3 [Wallemia mellicola]EIM21745.1 Prefoldin, subunit 3 [Wallemia mellicola CBS 633.66]TIB95935.1 Prefoldin, subunit 3 [Wallemia mellicola]TIC02096.1 Prefoldin, subunit 3 [Wallemia mellicola]TIC08587.1 Prefoldin, subunit 3 [Wallemia mellicola]|eukprot:XP_006958056.1 Prefoldin, subunit 3 [Wallemia mellicola CBS 633.66]
MSKKLESNPRNIPAAPFVNDVVEYIGGQDAEVDSALKQFQEMAAKYRYMEISLLQKKKSLDVKIPDIKKTLAMVKHLNNNRESSNKTLFELHDTLYAEAELENTDVVYLWLGANTMLSYKIPEAIALLDNKLKLAETSYKNSNEDLEFIREQTTITDVNTARIWNFDVKRRREKREVEEK